MFRFGAFEEHAFAVGGGNALLVPRVVDAKFTTICQYPISVQVHDHGIGAIAVALKLVQVFFVESAFFVKGVMEFITGNAGVTGTVEVFDEAIHQIEKGVFVRVVMLAAQPVDTVAPYPFVVYDQFFISGAGGKQ